MCKSKDLAAPLGNYISLVTRKNKNLESTKLVGISMYSGIIENTRRAQESYLKTGWIAEKGDFVVDLVNIQNNLHLSVDINRSDELVVISHIYNVFRITNPNLFGEFLWMTLKNSTIEKWLKWACHGSVRGTLSWENFIKLPISVPPLETQLRIVKKYEYLTKIIQLKKELNEKLEKWMQSLFHVLCDKSEKFTSETFGSLFQIVKGGRPPRSNEYLDKLYFCKERGIPSLTVSDINRHDTKFVGYVEEYLTEGGFKKSKTQIIKAHNLLFVGGGRQCPAIRKSKN